MRLRKITIQLQYGENDQYWVITDGKKRFGGKLSDNEYHNYLTEKVASNVGYDVVHGSGEHIGSVEDCNNHIRYETSTLMVRG